MNKKIKYKKRFKGTIAEFVPTIFALGVGTAILGLVSQSMNKFFLKEIKQRTLEFKLMDVIEIEKINKFDRKVEYHKLKGINKYIKNFLIRNPKWKVENEVYGKEETGRLILTRIYRKYHKKPEFPEYCPECGKEY